MNILAKREILLVGLAVWSLPMIVRAQAPASNVIYVPAPAAVSAALHEELGLLAVGRGGSPEPTLLVFFLDAKGNLKQDEPIRAMLPGPPELGGNLRSALGLVFHPQRPLLYVWQDLSGVKPGTPEEQAVSKWFDHLLIYAVTNNTLRFLQGYARGPRYAHSQNVGAIAIDPGGKKVFLPNLREMPAGRAGVGYLTLDPNGFPIPLKSEITTNSSNNAEIETATVDVEGVRKLPTGWGFLAVSAQNVIFAGTQGPAAWDTENRLAAVNVVLVPDAPNDCFMGGHSKVPAVFGAGYNSGLAFNLPQAEGYLTLLPQTILIPGASFCSAPVVMGAKLDRIAIGGTGKVHFVPIDKDGRFAGPPEELPVASASVRAIASSPKFDRLYIAVDR